MKTHTFIYSLIDPNTNEVRYIGKADSPQNRYNRHLTDARKGGSCYRLCWIKGLLNKGQKPILNIIERVEMGIWQEREIYWIGQFKNLTNLLDGGGDCPMYHKETIDKMKNTKANKPQVFSDESRKLLSAIRKAEWDNGIRSRNGRKWSNQEKEIRKLKMTHSWMNMNNEAKKNRCKLISKGRMKEVIKMSIDGIVIRKYSSAKEAEAENNISYGAVSACCRGLRKQCGGYKWKWGIEAGDELVVNANHN